MNISLPKRPANYSEALHLAQEQLREAEYLYILAPNTIRRFQLAFWMYAVHRLIEENPAAREQDLTVISGGLSNV